MTWMAQLIRTGMAAILALSSLGEAIPRESQPASPVVQAVVAPFLHPPFAGRTSVKAIFDHDTPENDLGASGRIITFNGYVALPKDGNKAKLVDYDIAAEGVPDVAYDQHEGIDFDLNYVPVLASAESQRVVGAQWADPTKRQWGYGLFVRLDHGNGYETVYAHLSALAVKACFQNGCTSVERGQFIGVSGNTGNSTGPHLHFGVYRKVPGKWVDPYGWDPVDVSPDVTTDPWGEHEQAERLWALMPDVSLGPSILPSGNAQSLPAPPRGYPPDPDTAVDDYAHLSEDDSPDFEVSSNCWTRSGVKQDGWAIHDQNLYTTVDETQTCWARWNLAGDRPSGTYAVYVHIPQAHACPVVDPVCPDPETADNPPLTREALYTVNASGLVAARPIIDQGLINQWVLQSDTYSTDFNINNGWIFVGQYHMRQGRQNYVELSNQTEGDWPNALVLADAVDFVLIEADPIPTPTATRTPTPTITPTPTVGYFLTGPYSLPLTTSAGTQYGVGVIPVPQLAGSTFIGIAVHTTYFKTMFRDAQPLGFTPSLYGGSSPWDFGAGWYCRTHYNGPEHPACGLAASLLGVTFAAPRPTSYWNDTGAPGDTAYSGFAIESYPCCSWPSVSANLTVYYIWSGPHIPTPTQAGTSSPSPTSALTPSPAPTGSPACSCVFDCGSSALQAGTFGTSPGLASIAGRYLNLLRQTADLEQLLHAVRDQVMAPTVEGLRLIELYEAFSPDLAEAMLPDRELLEEGFATVERLAPGLQALVDGRGGEVTITQEQVDAVEAFLAHVSAVGSLELQQVIAEERARNPLQSMVGLTMDQAWEVINGYSLEWLPPLDPEGTFEARVGDVIPVAFRLTNYTGQAIQDPGATLFLFDSIGSQWLGPIGIGSDPDEGLVYQGEGEYRFNLPTEGLYEGPYDIYVAYNATSVEPEFLRIWINANHPPLANAGDDQSVEEGTIVTLSGGGSTDPDDDSLAFHWDIVSAVGPPLQLLSADDATTSFTAPDDGGYVFRLTVSDTRGEVALDEVTVAVTNIPPTVAAILASPDPHPVGSEVQASAAFADPGTQDTHAAVWDWGDGSTSNGSVSESMGTRSVEGSHTYLSPGIYTLSVTIADDDGGLASSTFDYIVIYDPEGWFVTGGGWFQSPEGAYAPDPSLSGRATVGFVSKYLQGASVPTGVTEFQFRVAGLIFHSEEYEWLVVAGARGQFKGAGTINGEGDYGFMPTAVDEAISGGGDQDRLRIKIWARSTGEVVYDNQMGAEDGAGPLLPLGAGSVVIHS